MFDLERYRLTKWLKRETIGRLEDLSISSSGLSGGVVHRRKRKEEKRKEEENATAGVDLGAVDQEKKVEDGSDGDEENDLFGGGSEEVGTGIERERIEAAEKLKLWLNEMPDTFVTIT